ncbi:MAG: hypothetical protein DMF58_03365, partial [Acidobacteria bacterium]
ETAGQPNVDFPMPAGIAFADVDETSGGLSTPYCPPNVVLQEAFKDGTQPTNLCPLHAPLAVPPPPTDQFGTPVTLDTTGTIVTDTTATTTPPAPPPMTATTATSPPPTTTSNPPR